MARGLEDGLLRFCQGAWRDNDGDAVDIVEVVRCKDCKQSMLWRKPTDKVIGECFIRKMNSEDEQFYMVGADDFCSYGKRRDGNGR